MPNAVEAAPTIATSPAIGIGDLPEVLDGPAAQMQPSRYEPNATAGLNVRRRSDLAVEPGTGVELDDCHAGRGRCRIGVVTCVRDNRARTCERLRDEVSGAALRAAGRRWINK